MILMLKGANSNEVIDQVTQRIEQIQKSLPQGVHIKPFLDRSQLISKTTSTVSGNLLEGGLIVIFVLVLLLGNWRGGLIVASTIPLSLLFAFVLMHVFDVWANLMSLGAIDFGIIVDGAVIIVEATVFMMMRSLTIKKNDIAYAKEKTSQEHRNTITARASKKMMNAAFFGQLIILIVFLPILALEGVEGKMFKPMALTFIFAMLGAMVLCLTYVPMVSALFLRVKKPSPSNYSKFNFGNKFVSWVEEHYARIVSNALKKGKVIVAIALGFFALAVIAFSQMGGEFIPQLDEGDIAFHAILKPGSSLSETIATTTKIEGIIKAQFPEVKTVISRIGVADVPTDPMPMDIADVFVILDPEKELVSAASKDQLVQAIKEAVNILPGVNYEFTQPIEMRFNELLTGVREDVAIKLFGEDLSILANKAEEMGKIIAQVPGVADMKVEATKGLPQITITYDRNKLAQYGLQVNSLNEVVQSAFAGAQAGVIFEGEKRFDLVVRLQEQKRQDLSDIQNLYINLPNRSQIPLKEVAEVNYESGPMQISRDNTNRRTYVGINIRDRDVKSVVEDIQEELDAKFSLPAGYYIRYGGAFENLERASNRLQILVPIALVLIFILIYFALKSLSQTIMIYLAIPMAIIGGIFALTLRDMPFSISAGVGFIVLFGVAVLNGLVMISGLNELKEEGVTQLKDRIVLGTKRRIRPIMLTAFTDILGFLPMAISTSAGAEVQRPLATVVIGGLVTSTLLTLIILPIFYQWVEGRSLKFRMNKKWITAIAVTGFLFTSAFAKAQEMGYEGQVVDSLTPISLSEAVSKAQKNYPLLETRRLEVEKQQALNATAYDVGTTQLFTGGEELNSEGGIYTIVGVGQQKIDILGIGAKKRLQQRRIELAQSNYDLSKLEVVQAVKTTWAAVYISSQKVKLFEELDSIYTHFAAAVKLNYEVEAISRLEYAAANNQALQIKNHLQQAQSDYRMVIQQLNLLLGEKQFYTTPDVLNISANMQLGVSFDPKSHVEVTLSRKRIEEANAVYKAAQTELLPQFNVQGGLQQVNGKNGYYSYQAGISIPLFAGPERARIKAAKLDEKIAEVNLQFKQQEINTQYKQALQRFAKWQKSWRFYQEEVVPLAKDQRKGALLAYREGAVDYASFTQIMRDAIQTEIDALNALDNYLNALFELQYYKS